MDTLFGYDDTDDDDGKCEDTATSHTIDKEPDLNNTMNSMKVSVRVGGIRINKKELVASTQNKVDVETNAYDLDTDDERNEVFVKKEDDAYDWKQKMKMNNRRRTFVEA